MYKNIKTILDLIFALLLFFIMFAPMVIILLVNLISLGESPLFIQSRPGKNLKAFKLFKFKTMKTKIDQSGALLQDDLRVTRFGSFLRKSSLDELPQIFNIMMLQMSFIGPRPLLHEYEKHYNSEQIRRHEVKPGITGLAQINGRNFLSWEEKFRLDLEYVNKISLKLDIFIFFRTLIYLFKTNSVNDVREEIIPPFKND